MKRRLQVFISSTFTDLQQERQAAVSAVLKAGHIPAGMELFTAADRSQMETIKSWIDESDVYMLILGGRYGTVEPSTGISYTELEYDYAIEQKKSCFAVVVTDEALENKVKAGGLAFTEMQNPKELGLFRTKVLNNISSFFEDAKDIKLCVHETLADFATNRELKRWVRGDEIVDTKPLFEEIRKLSEENHQLKKAQVDMEKRALSTSSDTNTFKELYKVLDAINITVPAEIAGEKEVKMPLAGLFYANRDSLINGITNQASGSDAEHFYYFNVCPKLQIHGLAISEKVPGVRYRRYAITEKGQKFLAEYERLLVLIERKEREKKEIVQNTSTISDKSQAPAASPPVSKSRNSKRKS